MFLTIFLMGVALSMDAFAVAVCKGLKMQKINYKHMGLIALLFGGFQALMPLLGWLITKLFGENKIFDKFDHWIAFALLLFIGGKMAIESFESDEDECCGCFNVKELFVLAIATSIDALASGIAIYVEGVKTLIAILASILVIGLTTFVLSAIGVIIGNKFGAIYKSKAELAGGIILILIGVKILIEGLGVNLSLFNNECF